MMHPPPPQFNEKSLSQIPALKQLINLGYTYLSPKEALSARYGKKTNVILEEILSAQLRKINRIHYKEGEYFFSEENIQTAIQKLKNPQYDGLLKTNENIYDLLSLGTSLEQSIDGDYKSHSLKYIDFKNLENNVFHVTAEFEVECSRSDKSRRPDIVLFINGIPIVVIECKKPEVDIEEAVNDLIFYQQEKNIPKLFIYSQILIAINTDFAKYATTLTEAKFWSIWREGHFTDTEIEKSIHERLSKEERDKLFQSPFHKDRQHSNIIDQVSQRALTKQDKLIYSLCKQERLLDLISKFIIFDLGEKKIARYQQYFVIKSTIQKITKDKTDLKSGGIIWHTQGSGKSLTMVMLVRAILMNQSISNPRIILVTDREDLDVQLSNTFKACGLSMKRASSGRNLLKLLEDKTEIISTLIHKFDTALKADNYKDESHNIFVLVDESHRTNFGNFHADMRRVLPNACYLGFTGTPLLKEEKNSFLKFGSLIEPHYSIRQAVEDKAVVPLLYESRLVNISQNQEQIDLWFERHTMALSEKEKNVLKKKHARRKTLQKAEQIIYMIAYDIYEHFRKHWQGTGFKAQLVAPSKKAAIKYHEFLNSFGDLKSAVIISSPNEKGEIDEDNDSLEVTKFWQKMMETYTSEENYCKSIIQKFKKSEEPEILIVVDKLLTGFDAPKNTVLYLCKALKEHNLLQAIARVNRLCEGKEYGFVIDYVNATDELKNAFNIYDALSGYDKKDLEGAFNELNSAIKNLDQLYSNLHSIFKELKNKYDYEAYQEKLFDLDIREDFYKSLNEFAKSFKIALSSEKFLDENEDKVDRYKKDLKFFSELKEAVKRRYGELINYAEYDKKIEKLLNTYIYADSISLAFPPINIFDDKFFSQLKENKKLNSDLSTAAIADEIAFKLKKEINERLDTDPIYYSSLSEEIQKLIDDYRTKRSLEEEYLNLAIDLRNKLINRSKENIPVNLSHSEEAIAYFSKIQSFFKRYINKNFSEDKLVELASETALTALNILEASFKVDFWNDEIAIKKLENSLDDYLYDEIKNKHKLELSIDDMDNIIEEIIRIAKARRA